MGGVNRNTVLSRRADDLARVISQPMEMEAISSQLMKVVTYSVIAGGNFRHIYTVRRAQVGPASGGYAPTTTSNTAQETAVSVSELSNAGNYVSYGIDKSNIPAGFAPQPIPTGTYVMCVPHRITDGTLIWLIVNTQAVDGICPAFVGDTDFGTFASPAEEFEAGTFDAPEGDQDFGTY